jgi:hypothetical protein
MATTYERIRQVLVHLAANPTERQVSAVTREIRQRKLSEFRLRGTGSTLDDFVSEDAIARLLNLMSDLGLVHLSGGTLGFRVTDFTYIRTDTTYARKIDLATKELMAQKGVSLPVVNAAINSIKPPHVPDAPTIYESLGSKADGINQETFSKLLYLLSCAGTSIARSIHVHYHVD